MEPETAVRLRSGLSLNCGNPMETVLVIGANTRSAACSLKKLGFDIYSVDYFGTRDLQKCVLKHRSVLNQKANHSCGYFAENFDADTLRELAGDLVDQADLIIPLAGASPENFPKKKIMGNKDVESVENKYKLYKSLKDEFNLPDTYLLSDLNEAQEISDASPDKDFILKPVYGSGGYKIRELNNIDKYLRSDSDLDSVLGPGNLILQERINGQNISASVLSTGYETKTILTSKQIIGDASLGQMEPYGYCGNIAPLLDDKGAAETAEGVIDHLSLVGSNGVDFVLNDDDLFFIEVNPRLQGTLECAERSLGINMLEAHMEACRGNMMDVPPPSEFSVKMIVYAQERSHVGKLDLTGVFDIPIENAIIEKGEPVCTVISSKQVLEDAVYGARREVRRVYRCLNPVI